MREFTANNQADYYSGITSILVNGKNSYELKGKFLDDLHKNAFSETHREDTVEHIEYFLKIVDPIDLPNPSRTGKVNTLIIKWDPTNPKFENWLASKFVYYKTMDIFTKGALWDYWKLGSDEIKPANEETFDLEETNHDDEQEINEFLGLKQTYLEWYDALKDSELKDEALRNKAIMEGLIDEDNESSNNGWRRWDGYEIADHDQEEREYENEHKDKERCELFDDHKLPVCTIRRFEMIKYPFRDDEEYLAIKKMNMKI
ncbi:hypothetical protein Tco_0906747 [Tanacetum coccineum]|uniref:Uncharacterized protein n=1 Tax=Tanacetum coccineum TaxID=301880 RepID=A0ABQ5CJB7_9ASTR